MNLPKPIPIISPIILGLIVGLSLLFGGASWLGEPDGLRTFGVLLVFFVILSAYIINYGCETENKLYFSVGAAIWWVLIFAGIALVRMGKIEDIVKLQFSQAAVGLVVIWGICGATMLIISLFNPKYLELLSHGPYKWMMFFAIITVISATYSPTPMYSLAFSVMLLIAVACLLMLAKGMQNFEDVIKFFEIMHVAFLVVAVFPLVQFLFNQSPLIIQGRLGGWFAPTSISARGMILLLISLTLSRLRHQKIFLYKMTQIIGLVIAILGGGKTAIIVGIICVSIFLILSDRVISLVSFLALNLLLALSVIFFKLPLVSYFLHYKESDFLWTLTGRKELWIKAINEILNKPIIGHGYMSSKFLTVAHHIPHHTHNSFLEVLYNNGLIGFVIILVLNLYIVHNLYKLLNKRINKNKEQKIFSIGVLALFVFLFLTGMTTISFGGRPHCRFILFLTLLVLSQKMRTIQSRPKGELQTKDSTPSRVNKQVKSGESQTFR